MVPGEFITFFTTLAAVGATLFGLIFVVISIKPEVTRAETTSVMRQAQAASSYSALLNPLVISVLALLPHATIDTSTLIMSAIGLVTTLIMGLFLLRDARGRVKQWTSVFFLLVGLVLFGFELFYAIQLDRAPGESATLYSLATLLVLIDLYGIARAWDLVGVRQFHIREVLSPLLSKGEEETTGVQKREATPMTQNPAENSIHGEVTHLNPETLHKNPAFTQVVSVTGPARTIYIGGQDAVDAQGHIVGKGDLAAQTHQVLRNLRTALAAADARPEHIIKWNVYLVQGQSLQAGFTAFQQFWGDQPDPPTITGIYVSGLAHPDFLVEMDAIAVVPL